MDTSEKRNPHYYWIKPLTFSTPLLKDESIGSWLIRASLSQNCSLTTFIGFYWQHINDRLDKYDFDKGFEYIQADIHKDMAILAETTVKRFNDQTLIGFVRSLELPSNSSSALRWTLPLSRRHLYGRFGHPYCPDCMIDNRKAHLKLEWRLAWSVYCREHHKVLQTTCSYCGIPYQPLLAKVENEYINHCCHCNEKIYRVTDDTDQVDETVLSFQEQAHEVWHDGYGYLLGNKISSAEWFEFTLFAINLIRIALKNPKYMFGRLLTEFDIDVTNMTRPSTGSRLELLSVTERIDLFRIAYQVLQVSKEQWLESGQLIGLTKNSFNWGQKNQIPRAFIPVHTKLKPNPKPQCKKREQGHSIKSFDSVSMEWCRLKRKVEAQIQYERYLK